MLSTSDIRRKFRDLAALAGSIMRPIEFTNVFEVDREQPGYAVRYRIRKTLSMSWYVIPNHAAKWVRDK